MRRFCSPCYRFRALLLLFFGLALARADVAVAESSSAICAERFSLDELKARALVESPLVAEIDREFADQLALAFRTAVLANPELQAEQTYTRANVGGAHDPQAQISIAQPFRVSHFGARGRVAEVMRLSGDREKRSRMLEFVQRVALYHQTLVSLELIEEVLIDGHAKALRQAALIRDGVNKGLLSEGDRSVVEGEGARLEADAKGVASNLFALRREVAQKLGLTCLPRMTVSHKHGPLPPEGSVVQRAQLSDLSESARAEILAKLAAEEVVLAELDAIPAIAPRLTYQHTNDGGDFLGIGVTVPLPLWDRNQGERKRTSAEQKLAKARARVISAGGLETQVRALHTAARLATEQAEIYSQKVVPSFSQALRSEERLYGQGKASVVQLWQTFRTSIEVRIKAVQLELDAVALRSKLSVLVGDEV